MVTPNRIVDQTRWNDYLPVKNMWMSGISVGTMCRMGRYWNWAQFNPTINFYNYHWRHRLCMEINFWVFNISFYENKGPAVKLEAQPWCTQCLWRSKRTNRRQPGIENSLGGKVSISWQNGIYQERLHDPRNLCQPLFSELIQSRSFEYFRYIGLVKNAMSSLQCGHLNIIFYEPQENLT